MRHEKLLGDGAEADKEGECRVVGYDGGGGVDDGGGDGVRCCLSVGSEAWKKKEEEAAI